MIIDRATTKMRIREKVRKMGEEGAVTISNAVVDCSVDDGLLKTDSAAASPSLSVSDWSH